MLLSQVWLNNLSLRTVFDTCRTTENFIKLAARLKYNGVIQVDLYLMFLSYLDVIYDDYLREEICGALDCISGSDSDYGSLFSEYCSSTEVYERMSELGAQRQ